MIYLDTASTAQPLQEAYDEFNRVSRESWGNASSLHGYGARSAEVFSAAAETVRNALGVRGGRIIFTSGGTESNNLAAFGVCSRFREGRIISTEAEHPSCAQPLKLLKSKGLGLVRLSRAKGEEEFLRSLEENLSPDTVYVSIMAVNNETGLVFPLEKAAEAVRRLAPGAVFHSDAVQAFGKTEFPARVLDMCSISGHKIGAPQGIGALWVSDRVKLSPLIFGGHQQDGMRPGTLPVALCASFAAAASYARSTLARRCAAADAFFGALAQTLSGSEYLCAEHGSSFIRSYSLPRLPSEIIMRCLLEEGFAVSAGSACAGGKVSDAGRDLIGDNAKYSVRISIGESNTPAQARDLGRAMLKIIDRFPMQIKRGGKK